jgi:hypothetical protein
MEYPVTVDLDVTMRHIRVLEFLEIEAGLRYLLISLDHIDLLGARIVEPVART